MLGTVAKSWKSRCLHHWAWSSKRPPPPPFTAGPGASKGTMNLTPTINWALPSVGLECWLPPHPTYGVDAQSADKWSIIDEWSQD